MAKPFKGGSGGAAPPFGAHASSHSMPQALFFRNFALFTLGDLRNGAGKPVFFVKNASNEVPRTSRVAHRVTREKLVCAISGRVSANKKSPSYEQNGGRAFIFST